MEKAYLIESGKGLFRIILLIHIIYLKTNIIFKIVSYMSKITIVLYNLIHLNFLKISYLTFTFLLSLSIALLVTTLLFSLDHNGITSVNTDANAVKHHNHHQEEDIKSHTEHKIILDPNLPHSSSSSSSDISDSNFVMSNNSNNTKAAIINFDDGSMGQYTYAKPILDKYGLKATFFIVCNYANSSKDSYMNWQEITQLQNDGMDIESHSMNHKDLTTLSIADLDYEIGQSKQCLLNHGINENVSKGGIFAYPGHQGANDPTIVNTVAKYYNTARSGDIPLQFLNVPSNRYALAGINVALETQIDKNTKSFNDFQTSLDKFINLVNSQNKYNKNSQINAIPVIVYHKIDYKSNNDPGVSVTNPDLFDAEMKYLHDNDFKIFTMANLKYNESNGSIYLDNIS
jgi:peptidoglycan/xylan/chitin deacetylase (PgdA/CDA1 family)